MRANLIIVEYKTITAGGTVTTVPVNSTETVTETVTTKYVKTFATASPVTIEVPKVYTTKIIKTEPPVTIEKENTETEKFTETEFKKIPYTTTEVIVSTQPPPPPITVVVPKTITEKIIKTLPPPPTVTIETQVPVTLTEVVTITTVKPKGWLPRMD